MKVQGWLIVVAPQVLAGGLLLLPLPPVEARAAREVDPVGEVIPQGQPVDSVALTRRTGYWEEVLPEAERSYGYRVVVGGGVVRFQVNEGGRSGVVETFEVNGDTLRALVASAAGLDLAEVPESLSGKAPWCEVVATDAPSVVIEVFRGPEVERVVDNHGCRIEGDRSSDQLLTRLRDLERDATRVLRLEERFDAAPLLGR